MQKNYLFLNLMVLLISMTFGGFALQPSMAATGYTPTVTEDEITVFLETSFDNAKVWAWNDNPQLTTAGWPGDAMTLMGKAANGKNIFKWTYTGDKGAPTAIIFTHDGGHKLNGGDRTSTVKKPVLPLNDAFASKVIFRPGHCSAAVVPL